VAEGSSLWHLEARYESLYEMLNLKHFLVFAFVSSMEIDTLPARKPRRHNSCAAKVQLETGA